MDFMMQDINGYIDGFKRFEKTSAGKDTPWLHKRREEAIETFSKLGFPSVQNEDWRFTNIAPIARNSFRISEDGYVRLSKDDINLFELPGLKCNQLVFINGRFSPELSFLNQLPKGVKILNLKRAFVEEQELLEKHLSSYADFTNEAFTALNTAFMDDGALISISSGTALQEPIHLLYVSTFDDVQSYVNPRNLIIIEKNCQVNVVEQYASLSEGVYFSNVVTEIAVGENSVVEHYMIERESKKAFNVSTLRVQQERSSNLSTHSLLIGGSLVRNNVHPVLSGEGCHTFINGLFMSTGRQHMDNYMKVEHASPHCDSRQLYNGILDGKSRGVFHGRIIVHKNAQKTDAKQTNRNLLLSDSAQIDTKPQLEIYADDVKCTHGATIGQIDENALFYIRSRGLSLDSARAMLLYAFTRGNLERMKVEPIRSYIERLINEWFIQGNLIRNTDSSD